MVPNLWLESLTPQGGCPAMYSSFSSEFPPRGMGPCLIAFLPFLPNYMCIFLTALVLQESFSSFQLVFSENYSTCRCIFNVFFGGG